MGRMAQRVTVMCPFCRLIHLLDHHLNRKKGNQSQRTQVRSMVVDDVRGDIQGKKRL